MGFRGGVVQGNGLSRCSHALCSFLRLVGLAIVASQVIGIGHPCVRRREASILRNGLLKVVKRLLATVFAPAVEKVTTLDVELVGLGVVGRRLADLMFLPAAQTGLQPLRDIACNLLLKGEYAGDISVVLRTPQVASVLDLFELSADQQITATPCNLPS